MKENLYRICCIYNVVIFIMCNQIVILYHCGNQKCVSGCSKILKAEESGTLFP
jgi:hypothetical protein